LVLLILVFMTITIPCFTIHAPHNPYPQDIIIAKLLSVKQIKKIVNAIEYQNPKN
jgi:hypothetical protein